MLAYLHRELGSEASVFVKAAEEALFVASDPNNKTALRLQLFNSYLSLKNFDKAAEHLYHVTMIDKVLVNEENTLWLAHHFAAKQDGRLFELLKEILKYDDNFALHFDPEKTYLEAEVMKLAELITASDRKKLLLSLREIQLTHPNHSWKLQRQVAYELAKIHLSQGETDEALKIFEELAASAELTPSYYSNAAILEKNRILLSRCPACDRTEANPQIAHILSTLKDLQIQKRLACEPLHLEAALEYADLRASLVPIESKMETTLFFLQRIQEDFTANDDTIRQEYHDARLRFPEKDTLFQIYMKCINAEILALQAKMSGDQDVTLRTLQQATSLFEEVISEKTATAFLKKRAQDNLNNLR
jgi:tetratricopeptide (TPR) repeat protein